MTDLADRAARDKQLWDLAHVAAEMFLDEADRAVAFAIDMAQEHEWAVKGEAETPDSSTSAFLRDPKESDQEDAVELARRILIILRRTG